MAYSSTANICNRLFHIIAEFIPTTFNVGTIYSHTTLETNNSLRPGSLMWSKYIKPLHLHVANQKHAHVIFGFTTKEDANKMTVTPKR